MKFKIAINFDSIQIDKLIIWLNLFSCFIIFKRAYVEKSFKSKLCVWFAHNSMIWPRCKSEYSINTTLAHVYSVHCKNTLSNYTNCAIIDFRFDFRVRPTFSFRTFFLSIFACRFMIYQGLMFEICILNCQVKLDLYIA